MVSPWWLVRGDDDDGDDQEDDVDGNHGRGQEIVVVVGASVRGNSNGVCWYVAVSRDDGVGDGILCLVWWSVSLGVPPLSHWYRGIT